MIKLLIFDFDGTLVNTKKLYYNSIYKHLKENGIYISKEKFHNELLGLKLHDILIKLKIRKNLKEIKDKVHADVFSNIKKIKISKDINCIRNIKIKKIIVSNTITKHVISILRKNKINFFQEIYGGDKFKDKISFIKNYMKKKKLKKNEIAYIGDMIKDIEIARKVGIISISISHDISWNSRKELLKANPDYIITNLKEINKIIS